MPTTTYTMQFKADTSAAKREMNDLQKQLRELADGTNLNSKINQGITKELQEASQAAATLQLALQRATSASTGKLDLRVFNESIERSGTTIEDLGKKMSRLGSNGSRAFTDLTEQIVKAEEPLRQTSKLMDNLFRTVANSVKWQLSATAIYGIMDSISGAYQYAVDLDTSLNNIRIVSGQSAEQMAQFAQYANQAAKALSTTTVDYADAALIYYQQGLSEQQVKERTDLTVQMANVTGDTVSQVSDQLTSVWNNFYDGSHSLEYYIDVMTELGAATASSSSEIADGLQDFAAIAGMIGLDFDKAATMIATTASVSRQSADVIGTSFRSIFSRIQGLKMGETLEDGVDLNKYSTALQKVGINVLDATGNLRDMNSILDEMGEKWATLSQTEQTALAQTVGGVWQYNNLVTLMDNWDTFEQNLSIAQNSAGTLQEQSEIYEESWVAASNRVKAALEDVYNSILDSDTFKFILDGIADMVNGLDTFIDAAGGLPGVLALLGAISTKVFHDQMASGIRYAGDVLFSFTGLSEEYYNNLRERTKNTSFSSIEGDFPSLGNKTWKEITQERLELQDLVNNKASQLTEIEQQELDLIMQINDQFAKRYQNLSDKQDEIYAEYDNNRIQAAQLLPSSIKNDFIEMTDLTPGEVTRRVEEVRNQITNALNEVDNSSFKESLKKIADDVFIDYQGAIGDNSISRNLSNTFQELINNTSLTVDKQRKKLEKILNSSQVSVKEYYKDLAEYTKETFDEYNLTTNETVQKTISSQLELGDTVQQANDNQKSFRENTKLTKEQIEDMSQNTMTKATNGIVNFGNALANATMAVLTLNTAWNTLTSEDATFFEKATTSLMALGMALPAIVEMMQAITILRKADIPAALAQISQRMAHVVAIKAENVATKENTELTEINTKEKVKNTGATASQTAAQVGSEVLGNEKVPKNQSLANNAKQLAEMGALGSSVISIFKSIGSMALSALKIVARFVPQIIAITVAFSALKQATELFYAYVLRDDDEYNLEQINTAVQNLTQSYNDAKTAQQELTTNFENYQNAIDNINGLTRGTEEYTQAILEANEAAMQLIQSNEEISTGDWSVGTDGLIEIDESAIEKANQSAIDEMLKTQSATSMAAQQQNALSTSTEINKLVDEIGQSARTVINSFIENPNQDIDKESFANILGLNVDSPIVEEVYNARQDIVDLADAVRTNTTAQEQTAQSVAKQILSNNDLDSYAKSGSVYQRYYDEALNDVIENIKTNYKDYMKQAGFEQNEIDTADYNSTDQELTYTTTNEDGEEEKITISDDELANLVAASKAQDDLIESTKRLTDQIDTLKNSTDETDQSMASFLENGNFEVLTRRQYEAIQNMSEKDQKKALGLTGNTENDNQIAQDAGYEDAKDYLDSFNKALEIEWKIPEGISDQISEALTIRSMQNINSAYESMGEEAGQNYINGLNNLFNSIDFSQYGEDAYNQQVNFVNDLISIDWSDPTNSISNFKEIMSEYGTEVDIADQQTRKFLSSVIGTPKNIETFSNSIKKLHSSFESVQEISENLELGQILDKEDYDTLVAYNDELAKYFTILADGSAVVTGDPLDIQQEIQQTYIDSLMDSASYAQIVAENWDSVAQFGSSIIQSASDLKTYSDGTKIASENLKDVQTDLAQTQLTLLANTEKYGEKNKEQLNTWKETVDSGKATEKTYHDIANAVQNLGLNYKEAANYAKQYQQISNGIQYEAALSMDSDDIAKQMDEGKLSRAAGNAAMYTQNRQERWDGIETEEVEKYADYLQEIAEESNIFDDSMENNAEAAEEVALATIRTNNGMEDLIDTFEESSDIMRNSSKESEEYYEAMDNIREALSDVLGVSSDVIDGEFIADNLDLIQKAAEGDEEAIASLKSSLAEDIICRVMAVDNFDELDPKIQDLYNKVIQASNDLQIGVTANMDDSEFIQAMNELITATGMTVEEAQGIMNSLGYEPVFDETTAEVPTTITTTQIENVGWHKASIEGNPTLLKLLGLDDGIMLPTLSTSTYSTPGPSYDLTAVGYHANKDGEGGSSTSKRVSLPGNATAQIKSATRVSSPTYSGSNYSPRNSGGSPAYSPSGSGGSGGSGGSEGSEYEPTPAELMDYTKITEVVDRYFEITDSLDDMTDALEDASDAADRLYGKDRIAAMEKQRDLMIQQKDLLQQYRSEILSYLEQDKTALANNSYGIYFSFDADGDITNYTSVMTDLWNQLHAAESTYNSFATKEEQDAYQESTLDPLNKKIKEIQNLVDTYTDTQDLLVDVDNQIRDALNEWQDQNYEILTYKVELQIEINDMEQDRLDYYLNKYEDDFYKMAESMALTGDSFPLLTNNLSTYKDEINQLTTAYNNNEISQADFIEGMKDINSSLLENMNNLIDLDREMLEYYENTLDKAEDKLEDFTDQLDHQISVLEHYQNVLGLIGKEQNYDMIGTVLQGQFNVAQNQLITKEKWVETLKKQMNDIQYDLLNATDEAQKNALNEQLTLITQKLNEAEKSVNSLRESVLELAQSILENDLAKYAEKFSQSLVEGLGFNDLDEYLDNIDRLNTSQEEYLTTTNKIYETNKLIRQAQEDMAENDSLLAKQKYNDYVEYIKQLQQQGQLSEYELSIAQTRYEVLQAQIALEEAQNAKDSMRLVRDSQGNYNYVYTANQDNISQAQQALDDAENNLYNIGLQGAQDYQDKYSQTLQQAFEEFKDLSEQYKNGEISSEEEYNQKRLELQKYYYGLLQNYQDLYYMGHDLLVNESYNKEADYLFAGIGNLEDFRDATDQYLEDCNNAFDTWKENTNVAADSVGQSMGELQNNVNDVTISSDNLTSQIQDNLIPTLEDELEAVRDVTNLWLSHRDALYDTLRAYEELQQGVQNTVSNAAGVQPGGVLPNIPDEYNQDYAAIMAAYLQHGGSIDDSLFQTLLQQRNEKIEWLAANGYSSSYYGTYGDATLDYYKELMSGGGDQDWYNYAANMYSMDEIRKILEKLGLPTFKTGGYTGSWGPQGRLAILHEKELILNQDDTDSLINIIRDYGNIKNNNSINILNSSFNNIISKIKTLINSINLNPNQQITEQRVSIEASFPNVSVANEIEEAFNNILNQAAQYASLNRTNY